MNRFKELPKEMGLDAVCILGDSNTRYATGYLADYRYIVITLNRYYYLTDGRFTIEGRKFLSEDWEIIEINRLNAFQKINELLKSENAINIGYDGDISYYEFLTFSKGMEQYNLTDINNEMLKRRVKKNKDEIDNITMAQRIAERSLEELKPYFKAGVTEKEICARLEYIMRKNGSEGVSFDTIVAFGENSAMAHAKPSERELRVGDTMLFDFGATKNGYHSDMTRTFVYGECSDILADMYNAVLEANIKTINCIKSGINVTELDKIARDTLKLYDLDKLFTHSTGHGVGVDIHEEPYISAIGGEYLTLDDGMVITVEPGVYVEGLCGIRIEDMIVVRDDGYCNLTTSDKKLDIINL